MRNSIPELVEGTVSVVTRPFSEAPDLETYARRGYNFLGFLVGVVVLLLWWQGILTTPLSHSNEVVRAIYKVLTEKTVIFKYVPDNYVPIVLLPLLAYIGVGVWPRGRIAVGEVTANASFWLLNRGISAGEWCIEHRWWSLLLIGALSAGIAVLITIQVQRMTSAEALKSDFDYWLEAVDQFMTYNPVTKTEDVAYKPVRTSWRRDFNAYLAQESGSTHPAICLQEMLDELYREKSDHPWSDFLQMKMPILRKKVEKCAAPARAEPVDPTETRSRALINLLMARITVRVADDAEVRNYSSYAELKQALDLFETVAELDYGSGSGGYAKNYRADALNGQGTVYSNALSAYMKPSPALNQQQLANLAAVCGTPAQCALKSLSAYQAAGRGWEECSYRSKRERNNTADLLIRIGQHYGTLSKSLNAPPFGSWMRTRAGLAQQIESDIQRLMSCNKTEPFLSAFVITAAQGLALCANLRRMDGQSADAHLAAAGRYLRLANSFESQNVSTWDHSYFCFAVQNGKLDETFRNAIMAGSDGLPNADEVVRVIEKRCQ